MNETEILIIGFIGGTLGSLTMMWALQSYYKYTTKSFLDAQYKFKREYDIKMMSDNVKTLRMQVTALQSQFGVNTDLH